MMVNMTLQQWLRKQKSPRRGSKSILQMQPFQQGFYHHKSPLVESAVAACESMKLNKLKGQFVQEHK